MDSQPVNSSSGGSLVSPGTPRTGVGAGPGSPAPHEEAPVDDVTRAPVRWVEPEVLAELEAGLESPELARGFAHDFAALWDQRFTRLAAAVQGEDHVAALDTVVSLRITSAMVGALQLSRAAQAVEEAVHRGSFAQARELLPQVSDHGSRTVSELRDTQPTTDV